MPASPTEFDRAVRREVGRIRKKPRSLDLSHADLERARQELHHRDFLRREGLAENPPCIHCGAPIDLDGRGHEDGCSYGPEGDR